MKYTKNDILQMLRSQYEFSIAFDPVVIRNMNIEYDSLIFDWQDACDLVSSKEIASIFHEEFNINRPVFELEHILHEKSHKTVGDFCEYIAFHAKRESIESVKLLGKYCRSAAIFKELKRKLTEKGANTSNLKPSSHINPFFLKHGGLLFNEVNLMAPGTLSKFEYTSHKLSRIGRNITILGFLLLIVVGLMWSFHWILLLPIILGIVSILIGDKKQPEKLDINRFKTFRELIYSMEHRLKGI